MIRSGAEDVLKTDQPLLRTTEVIKVDLHVVEGAVGRIRSRSTQGGVNGADVAVGAFLKCLDHRSRGLITDLDVVKSDVGTADG